MNIPTTIPTSIVVFLNSFNWFVFCYHATCFEYFRRA